MSIPKNVPDLSKNIDLAFDILEKTKKDGWNREQIFDNFARTCEFKLSAKEFFARLSQSKDTRQVIHIVAPFFNWISSTLVYKQNFQTSNDISSYCCQHCEYFLKENNLPEALLYSNRALAYVDPRDMNYYASALYWRSLILYKLHHLGEAMTQLELISAIIVNRNSLLTNQNDLIVQLKIKCAAKLKLNNIDQQKIQHMERQQRKRFVNNVIDINFQTETPGLSKCVEIKWNPQRGRHLVATKEIEIGTVLLVEKPMAVVLNGTLPLTTTRCHHCLAINFKLISCPNCVFAFFCTPKCQQDAAFYHTYECPCLPDLRSILLNQSWFIESYMYLSFKLICMWGPAQLFEIFRQRESPSSQNSQFHQISQFTSGRWNPEEERHGLPLISLMLAALLKENTNYFEIARQKCVQTEMLFQNFTAETILKNFYILKNNAYGIGEFPQWSHVTLSQTMKMEESTKESENLKSNLKFQNQPYACAIYPTASLLNHSCDVNVDRIPTGQDGGLMFVAIKSILQGEELVVSYGAKFTMMERRERQNYLLHGYNFKCTCIACLDNWAKPIPGRGLNISHCCGHCSEKLKSTEKTIKKMTQLTLNEDNKFKCSLCKFESGEKEFYEEFNKNVVKLQKSQVKIRENQPLEVIEMVREAIKFFQNWVVPPSAELIAAQNLYFNALNLIVHFSK